MRFLLALFLCAPCFGQLPPGVYETATTPGPNLQAITIQPPQNGETTVDLYFECDVAASMTVVNPTPFMAHCAANTRVRFSAQYFVNPNLPVNAGITYDFNLPQQVNVAPFSSQYVFTPWGTGQTHYHGLVSDIQNNQVWFKYASRSEFTADSGCTGSYTPGLFYARVLVLYQ